MIPPPPAANSSRPSLLRTLLRSSDGRLRSAWRLVLHGTLTLFLWLAVVFPLALALAVLPGGGAWLRPDSPELLLLSQAAMLPGTLAATWLARRLFDRRSVRSLGLALDSAGARDLLVGLGIAFCMMATIFLIHLAAGWLVVEGWGWEGLAPIAALRAVVLSLALYVLVGLQEEILFRGYQLQNLVEGLPLPVALIASSVLFAAAHLGNPGASWNGFVGIALAGLLLAFAWLRTRRLWLAIGLHIGWNFFEGTVFGFPVSGLGGFHLIRHRVSGPALFTGGAFGPEAGLVLIPAIVLAAYLIVRCTRPSRLVSA